MAGSARSRAYIFGVSGLLAHLTWPLRRRSSVVERVIGNDEVLSSILSGGTINQGLSKWRSLGSRSSKHIVSTGERFRVSKVKCAAVVQVGVDQARLYLFAVDAQKESRVPMTWGPTSVPDLDLDGESRRAASNRSLRY